MSLKQTKTKMETIELFDKDGNAVLLSDFLNSFLKDNLTINISTDKGVDYGNTYTEVNVSISLNGKEICSDHCTIG